MPLVFVPDKELCTEPMRISSEDRETILASPWPIFSLEVEGKNNFVTIDDMSELGVQVNIEAILCIEKGPGKYEFVINSLMTVRGNLGAKPVYKTRAIDHKVTSEIERKAYFSLVNLVNEYLERMYSNDLGFIEKKNFGKSVYKYKKTKSYYKPKNVIYVSKKTRSSSSTTTRTQTGETVHKAASTVRAHWRRLVNPESMGLDRQRKRTVKGFTWVTFHFRGDEDGILKIRKILT